jgi:hypothetical protein
VHVANILNVSLKHTSQIREQCYVCVGFEIFTVATMKNAVFFDVGPSGFDVSEERVASIFRVEVTRVRESVRWQITDYYSSEAFSAPEL